MLAQRGGARPHAGAARRRSTTTRVHARGAGKVTATPQRRPQQPKENPLTVGLVTVLTESLRLLGVGRDRYEVVAAAQPRNKPLRRGDVAGVIARLRTDFKQAYFVTGVLDDSIYEPDCFFADPTVAFRGVALWKRNLALLVPFLEEPSVQLRRIGRAGRDETGAEVVRAEWRLRTYLRLPWRPLIDINGSTDYALSAEGNRIARHVESWEVSGTEALLQMFRPAPRGA